MQYKNSKLVVLIQQIYYIMEIKKESIRYSPKKGNNLSGSKKKLLEAAVKKVSLISSGKNEYKLRINKKKYAWSTSGEKIAIIRDGLPYAAIEAISKQTNIPVKHYLNSLEIVQTTYNNKKRSNQYLSKQDSESVIELIELYHFGLSVFNNEIEKFQRWLRKPNISLGATTPDSMFDSLTGINEVKKALNRIEYGNMA